MKRLIVVAALAAVAIAGCGSDDEDDAASSGSAGSDQWPPENVDPCTVLSDAELASFDLIVERKRTVSELDAQGCGWTGREFGITLTTDPDSVAVYLSRRDEPVFEHMDEIEIGGRPAIEYDLVTHSGDCGVTIDLGNGSLDVGVVDSSGLDAPRDLCADARAVMELVVRKLPRR